MFGMSVSGILVIPKWPLGMFGIPIEGMFGIPDVSRFGLPNGKDCWRMNGDSFITVPVAVVNVDDATDDDKDVVEAVAC